MKKYILSFIIVMLISACTTPQQDLDKMADGVRSHLRYKDVENNTVTRINEIKGISCEKIPEDERQNPDEVYLLRVYIRGTWNESRSYRIYNIDDTVQAIFNKNKTFLRMDTKNE